LLISASATGFYGDRAEEVLTEDSPRGQGFLSDVCQAWEAEAQRARESEIRVLIPRLGVVLGSGGGALQQMIRPFSLGLGAKLGSGRQWMSWIHIDDAVAGILAALQDNRFVGAMNWVAPECVTNATFTATLAGSLGRPAFFSAPEFILRTALGEMAHILLDSAHVLPERLKALQFPFRYPTLKSALEDVHASLVSASKSS